MDHSPGFLRLVEETKRRIREVTVEQVHAMLQGRAAFELIDVREEHEWVAGHLPRARHLCKGIIERDIERLLPDRDTALVLYCGGGFRSALAADNLQKMGYTNVASMDGGWRGWSEAKLPVEK